MKSIRQRVNQNFPYKVWLGTVCFGSVAFIGAVAITNGIKGGVPPAFSDTLLILFFTLIGSFILSLPALVVHVGVFLLLEKFTISLKVFKVLSAIVGIALVFLSLYGLDYYFGGENGLVVAVPAVYAVVLVVLTSVFRLQKAASQIADKAS